MCATLFLAAMLGQGLLISVVTRNQMVATQMATMSAMLPSMLLSGFLFPVQNMPLPVQVIANILPAKHFVSILRGVMVKGAGLTELWPDVLALAAFTTFVVVVATRRFQRRLA
jgi:ABC-2 type transport system permease protein